MGLMYKIASARRVLQGLWWLRRCTHVGSLPRVYGRPRITNLGEIIIGDKFLFFSNTVPSEMVTYPGGRLEIGSNVFINYGASLSAHQLLHIGDGCQIGSYACMMDNDYHSVEDRSKPGKSRPIILGKNVWLGVRVVVLKGVSIGDNSVIGAGSVVTKDIPANCMAAGMPAKVIRTFTDPSSSRVEGNTQ